ncbi:DUF2917 domain-containing protein [Rhizobacter sp. J219]|jgi:hypothetical protein|uniref:DUF2917 domain-containing protein n=1 Tax=Rhizobacter sp. J219 TaxID=2898430 RepID=UPI002150D95A|nr:DUF2917 domain-containing protein [Rhizobacter sp. J219]MCR5884037.1 DUF2917 domain-containing protein [Rhizobacter sp. J219]
MTQATMTISQQSGSADWALPEGQALRLDIGPGARELRVTRGRLWLTREGSADEPAEDLWLTAGDTLALESGSEWVVEGWGETGFQLLVPPRACPSFARRLAAVARPSSARRRVLLGSPALG